MEFLRESRDGRITLVLHASAAMVRTLWAVMDATDLAAARDALRLHENISEERAVHDIGTWAAGEPPPPLIVDLPQWAAARGVQAVVWTALGARFADTAGRVPTPDEVIEHLGRLTGAMRDNAERYIRYAPRQIDTFYRRRIEATLNWTPLDSAT